MHLRRILHMQLSIFSLLYPMSDYEHFVAREAHLTGHPQALERLVRQARVTFNYGTLLEVKSNLIVKARSFDNS